MAIAFLACLSALFLALGFSRWVFAEVFRCKRASARLLDSGFSHLRVCRTNPTRLALLPLLLLPACRAQDEPATITDVRTVAKAPTPVAPVDSAARFGYVPAAQDGATSNGAARSSPAHPSPEPPPPSRADRIDPSRIVYETPPGWQPAAPRPMRLVNFTLGQGGRTECYISLLPGAAGGTEANINRWRGQMGLPPLTPDEISRLDKIKLLGKQAPLVRMAGAYQGMGNAAQPGFGLLGTIADLEGQCLFVKLVGPAADVAAERERFIIFCQSIKLK